MQQQDGFASHGGSSVPRWVAHWAG
jgi:hypothetical protein